MQDSHLSESFKKLVAYCESESYKGYDPYDGLNSGVFNATPLKHSSFFRLAWIQLFKLSPINLRPLLLVKKGYNPKGLGLFLSGYCNLYDILKDHPKSGDHETGKAACLSNIRFFADKLIEMQSRGYSGACWGYNFDWQNRIFFQPAGTPTVVATSFVSNALMEAYKKTNDGRYLETALSSSDFVVKDLKRTQKENGFIFSYSPYDQTCVYNASLLGSRLLASCYDHTKNDDLRELSLASLAAVLDRQNPDGSWIYGESSIQGWIDSFHTGFNLECIFETIRYTNEQKYMPSFTRGIAYYLNNFFTADGIPKYYHNNIYPVDIHSPAQLIATLAKTGLLRRNSELATKMMNWTIRNMQDKQGYFYYQVKKGISSKIPYMRWSQAWMFYAFTHYFKSLRNEDLD